MTLLTPHPCNIGKVLVPQTAFLLPTQGILGDDSPTVLCSTLVQVCAKCTILCDQSYTHKLITFQYISYSAINVKIISVFSTAIVFCSGFEVFLRLLHVYFFKYDNIFSCEFYFIVQLTKIGANSKHIPYSLS